MGNWEVIALYVLIWFFSFSTYFSSLLTIVLLFYLLYVEYVNLITDFILQHHNNNTGVKMLPVYLSVPANFRKWQVKKYCCLSLVTGKKIVSNSEFIDLNNLFSSRFLARWASRHPEDGHFLKKMVLFFLFCLINGSFEQATLVQFGRPLLESSLKACFHPFFTGSLMLTHTVLTVTSLYSIKVRC